MKKKKDEWIMGLTWSDTELEGITRGMGSEAYSFTYRRGTPTKAHMRGAKRELKMRMKKRGLVPKDQMW
jgi:hypothetical protein